MSDDLALPDGLPEYGLTGLGALGVLWVLGPSVRAVGRNLGKWTEYHTANLLKLSEKVERRLAESPESAEGEVHPRVAKEVLDAAAWIDDDVHQEYLSALLVGARVDGNDDSSMYDVRLVSGMSAGAVRLHHAIYSSYFGTRDRYAQDDRPTFHRPDPLEKKLVMSATNGSLNAACAGGRPSSGLGPLIHASDILYRERLVSRAVSSLQ
ncbi:hypothetical protein AB0301_16605 [Microbacterium profundi]|uniref:PNPLA domain-containing protein n=1 Tax=Microbacterium profundi TaxID=450380 RepID=A0ABV3LL94_9MICO